eukprot:jgi/Mesvir1/2104/Mv16635-RA.1
MAGVFGMQACLSARQTIFSEGFSRAHVWTGARRPFHDWQVRKQPIGVVLPWRTPPRAYIGSEPNILFETAKPWWDELTSLMPELSAPQPVISPLSFVLIDPWGTKIDALNLSSALFAVSLFPYLGFLYHLTKSKTCPPVTLFGFYFLLVFVAVTIPAGIYAKVEYQTSLANVDWLHGAAESFLTITNLLIVIGLQRALDRAKGANPLTSAGGLNQSAATGAESAGGSGATAAAIDGTASRAGEGRAGQAPARDVEETVDAP